MNPRIAVTGAIALVCAATALAADMPRMRGDRLRPLTAEELTPEQRGLVDALLSGPRGDLNGPFNVYLRSPDLGDRLQRVGEFIRFRTSLPDRLNQFAILITAREWTAQYVWHAHYGQAIKAGLNPGVAADIAAGKPPAEMQPDEAIVYQFCRELF